MSTFQIEGSFTKIVEADNREDAENFALEYLEEESNFGELATYTIDMIKEV